MERLQHWRRPDGTRIEVPIEEEVRKVLVREKKQGNRLKVCIGTDSQVKGTKTEFATFIVFLRLGKGGFMYVLPELTQRKMSIKERMLTEVPGFKSNAALSEAMGYIQGMGFAFRAKPHAFASSSCANKMVQ